MSLFRRSVIIISAVLIFFGSGGWVLTDHFCREETSSCVEPQAEACCCGDDQSMSDAADYADNTPGDVTTCCFDQSTYFSMPVYRLEVNNLIAPDFQLVDLISYYLPEVTPAIIDNNCSLHKPPPLNKGGTPLLFETGLLRI